ncbi:UDP-N-acetylmuramoyl-tripeptide--D-alanyl-D-alanine ligase [Patescibacteria group bacterium]
MKSFIKKIIFFILTLEARLVLRKYKPRIIAVTGNVGKTSTKDAIYSILKNTHYVRKSEKSFNSEIGVPLTILGCDSGWNNPFVWISNIFEGLALILLKNHYPKILVLEIGADRPGDIESVTRWLKPDIAVITKIGDTPVHVEYFSSASELVKEKAYLATALGSDGMLILNADDKNTLSIKQKSKARTMTFGLGKIGDIRASNEKIIYNKKGKPKAINFKVNYGSNSLPVELNGTVGFHYIYSVLAAMAVGITEGVNLISAAQWIAGFSATPGRLKIIEGISDSTILDDTYNAAPAAVNAAIDALSEVKTEGRKIAVLGDMMELGKQSVEEHRKIGEKVAETCDFLVTVGTRSADIWKAANKKKMYKKDMLHFASSEEAGEKLKKILKEGDIVLVKGSQSARMERVVERIMAHPEDKQKLLVRQESEWLKR